MHGAFRRWVLMALFAGAGGLFLLLARDLMPAGAPRKDDPEVFYALDVLQLAANGLIIVLLAVIAFKDWPRGD